MPPASNAPPLSLGRHFRDREAPQLRADVAVIVPTILRPALLDAVRSVYDQTFDGRVQLLIGADLNADQADPLFDLLETRPANLSATVLTLPYSTSSRHGGVHPAWDGGALRPILSFMANALHLAYLDDDNTWEPDHLASLMAAVQGKAWAYSLRLLLDEETGAELGVDVWDAVGPGRGRFKAQGGLVDPSCLLVNKLHMAHALWLWSDPGPGRMGVEADRRFAEALFRQPFGRVERPTVRYRIRTTNILRKFLAEGTVFD